MVSRNESFYGRTQYFSHVLQQQPNAYANIKGSAEYPSITGKVYFYQTRHGVLVFPQVFGLPISEAPCKNDIFAFHIHSGASCTGNDTDPFADALTHYNPGNCAHPSHAGDLLPLWGNQGYSFQIFLTDRVSINEVMGKTIIIHRNPDDFTSQPAGNAGAKIACGKIEKYIK